LPLSQIMLPTSARSVTYSLFPDTDVRLLSSSISALTPSGAAPALDAPAARAAAHLGLAVGTDSFDSSQQEASLPKVSISNFCVCLVMPAMPNVQQEERRGYLVTLHLSASLASQPPRAPYLVSPRLSLPIVACR
jgi:hypothetical protein